MEIEIPRPAESTQTDEGGGLPPPPLSRARTSLRQRYEAEARVLERRMGGLETIRATLGLSQRKMAQLLLVDPSAWTRWTQSSTGAPPHVWRSLAWYLALQEKYPALDAAFWLQGVARLSDGADQDLERRREIEALQARIRDLEARPVTASSQEAAETRALANLLLAIVFTALGILMASFF